MVALALIGAWIFDYEVIPVDPLKMFLVIILLASLGLGVGLIVSVLGALSEELGKFVPNIMRPLYFLSGIIFPLEAIPVQYHPYLLWNPILHGVEQFRQSYIAGYPSMNTSLYYVFLWAIISLLTGLLIYRVNSVRVLTR